MVETGEQPPKQDVWDRGIDIVKKAKEPTSGIIDINVVESALDEAIAENADIQDELINAICGPVVEARMKLDPETDFADPKRRYAYDSQVIKLHRDISDAFDNARDVAEMLANRHIYDDFGELDGSMAPMIASHPEMKRVPIQAWAEQTARNRLPPPDKTYDKAKYEALIRRERDILIDAFNKSTSRKKSLDDMLADPAKWAQIKLPLLDKTLHRPVSRFEEEEEGDEAEYVPPTYPKELTDALNLYKNGTMAEYVAYLSTLPEEKRTQAQHFVVDQIVTPRLAFSEKSLQLPKGISATPLIKQYYQTALAGEKLDSQMRISRWQETVDEYLSLVDKTANATPLQMVA